MQREDIPSLDDLEEDERVQVSRYLSKKVHRTMLGYACIDPDGERGEAKIKLILETARYYQANMRSLLASYSKKEL